MVRRSGGADPRFPTDPTVSSASAVQVIGLGAGGATWGWAGVARGRRRFRVNIDYRR